jgi:hypothetical protein
VIEGWAASWFLAIVGSLIASMPFESRYEVAIRIFGLCLMLPVFFRLIILAVTG